MRSIVAQRLGLDPGGLASMLVGQPMALGAGFLTSILLVIYLARRRGLAPAISAELLIAAYAGALLVGRIFDATLWGQSFWRQPWRLFDPTFGGVSTLGGLFGATAAALFWARRRRVAALTFLDAAAPAAGLVVGWFKLSCLLAGCCYGTRTSHALAVRFPASSIVYYDQLRGGLIDRHYRASLPVHPVQAYEALFGLAVFAALMLSRPLLLRRPGLSLLLGAALLLTGRLAFEGLREHGALAQGGLSAAQIACILGLAGVGALSAVAPLRQRVVAWLTVPEDPAS